MKVLLITISIVVGTLTANAHCGGCGTDEKAHSQDEVAKSCCSDSGSCCSEKKACLVDKKSCDTKEKSCCGTCGGDKASSADKDGDDKKSCGVSEEATSAAKSTIPMPKMSCCPADA
jgi:hypothetical protein